MGRGVSIILATCMAGYLLGGIIWFCAVATAQEDKTGNVGFVVSADGYVVTPYSAIAGCLAVYSPTLGPLRVAHVETQLDLALLQAPNVSTTYARLGNASAVAPGSPTIIAAAAPGGDQTADLEQVPGRFLMVSSSMQNAIYMTVVARELARKKAAFVLDNFGGIVAVIVRNLDPKVMVYNDFVIWAPPLDDEGVSANAVGEVMLRAFLQTNGVTFENVAASDPLSAVAALERLREATTQIACVR